MLFNNTPPVSLSGSKTQAVWYKRYSTISNIQNIYISRNIQASFIKIQRESSGILSLAEVEVYNEKLNTLGTFTQGSLRPTSLTNPLQPEESFKINFNDFHYDGRWVVQLKQTALDDQTNTATGYTGSYGTISDAAIIITDLAGVLHTYHQDIWAEVMTLPKYGNLTLTNPKTNDKYNYLNWKESFEVSSTINQLTANTGSQRPFGQCYNDDCSSNYNVRPGLDSYRILGDKSAFNIIRDERLVSYQPNDNFLGPDFFTYRIHDGVTIQKHSSQSNNNDINESGVINQSELDTLNQVTIHMRYCRLVAHKLQNNIPNIVLPICSACQLGVDQIFVNQTSCNDMRTQLCSIESTRIQYISLCLTCTTVSASSVSASTTNSTISNSTMSTTFSLGLNYDNKLCQAQTLRVISFLTSHGLCSVDPLLDCSTEFVTLEGKERVNYLTLTPPLLDGSYSSIGNSIGGYGWFSSPPLP